MCITPRLPSFSGKVPLSFLAEIFGNFRRNSVFASFRDFRRLPVKFRQGYLRQAIAAIFIIFTFFSLFFMLIFYLRLIFPVFCTTSIVLHLLPHLTVHPEALLLTPPVTSSGCSLYLLLYFTFDVVFYSRGCHFSFMFIYLFDRLCDRTVVL